MPNYNDTLHVMENFDTLLLFQLIHEPKLTLNVENIHGIH